MSETPCQPSQQENGHIVTDPADIATETATSNPEQDTTASKREEVSQFSPHARSAEELGATSETPDNEFAPGFPERLKEIIRGGAVVVTGWNNAETAPDATQSADNGVPAVTTLPQKTPAENAVSGAMQARIAPNGEYIPLGAVWSEQEQKIVPMQLVVENLDDADEMPVTMSQIGLPKHIPTATEALNQFAESWGPAIAKLDAKIDEEGPWGPFANEETRKKMEANGKKLAENLATVMRACNKADDEAHATGTEALVCADIARRQRKGIAKYGKTVIGNQLSFAQWLQHFYEELLDGAIYAKRILTMNHDNQNENQSDGGADGVLPDSPAPVQRHRKPGAGRKPKPCPNCGATKSIGSTVKNGIPTRRCKVCGHVVQTYPHLANGKTAE